MASAYNFGGKGAKADSEGDSEEEKIKMAALSQMMNGRSMNVSGGAGNPLFGRPQAGSPQEVPASPAPAARPTMPEGNQTVDTPQAPDPKKYMTGTPWGMFAPSMNKLPAKVPEDMNAVHLPGRVPEGTELDPHDADRNVPSQRPGPPGQPLGRQQRAPTLGSIRPR